MTEPRRVPPPSAVTVAELIQWGALTLESAGVWFGHGSDNARDEAAELVFFAAGLRHEDALACYPLPLLAEARTRAIELFARRIEERLPAAYLTQRMWFAGIEFYVDERVLVPRSPLAELIEAQFAPWVDPERVHAVLDIGTGSGCIAIATALHLPWVEADAADISPAALAVAAINCERHGLTSRVRMLESDVFSGCAGRRYDLIIANPPYVGTAEFAALPGEYHREPALGLVAGADGLDVVRRIFARAAAHLMPGGTLLVEVGNSEDAVLAAFPTVPFTWLEFERGGGGVLLLTRAELEACARELEV
jgi:ribosomal protein L3 glutamine methyltransferase